ncbi:MAG: hypothetical protein PUP91_38670 [Rhizonema sp. PD37]|nr:hypothetical protein [Rhizonema sp. PD37]
MTTESYPSGNDDLTSGSENQAAIDMMLEVYKSVLYGSNVFYCSAPITSGKRYLDWLNSIGKCFVDIDGLNKHYQESHFNKVIEPNRLHSLQFIQKLRKQKDSIVIDPSALSALPNWTQQDWRSFWGKVIESYVNTVFFINDWQYSNGCVYEFWISQRKGISVFDETKHPLTLEIGISLITEAILMMQRQKQLTTFIEMMLERLKEL